MRYLLTFLLACALLPAFAATTTVDCRVGGLLPYNKVTQMASQTAENTLTVQISPGQPVTIMLVCDQAWFYRSTTATSTTQMPIAAGQSLVLRFGETTSVFFLRQTVDGTLCATPLQNTNP